MKAKKLDGTALAKKLKAALKVRVAAVTKARSYPPGLLIFSSAHPDRASKSYRDAQFKACTEIGISAHAATADWNAPALVDLVARQPEYDGVIFDLPLPKDVDLDGMLAALPPVRDAEGATPYNMGRLFSIKSYSELARRGLMAPCTAQAIAELVRAADQPLGGKTAVVLGRSSTVGRPAAHLLSCLDLTVTLCHSKSAGLAELVGRADVVVSAIGQAGIVKGSWIKPGAIVIDAGINDAGGKLVGDVEPSAADRAGFYTPVPGGVGPVTTAMLLANVVTLAERTLP